MASVCCTTYTIYRYYKINTVCIQGLEGHKMAKQLWVKTECQLWKLSFVLFSGLEEEF